VLFSANKAAHRAVIKGQDKSNLGRWVWTKYKGKRDQTLRIFTAYRPNPPQGQFTIYAQQIAFLTLLVKTSAQEEPSYWIS
jgi:hypothetical protein